jgi:hypothetical protein
MLMFLAGVLEQMDLALEHVSSRGVHDARFGLMLTDNAVELVLHQIAKDQSSRIKMFHHLERDYAHKGVLAEALGRSFDAKLKFARVEGKLTEEESRTFDILHSYRNEVYHIGLQHQEILPDVAEFYFVTACRFLERYEPRGLSWGSNTKLPDRAKKYFGGSKYSPAGFDDFPNACRKLAGECAHKPGKLVACLAAQMERVIDDCDTCIDIVAQGVYVGDAVTRDKAIVDCQAWPLSFSQEGLRFAREKGFSGSRLDLVGWLGETYPFKVKTDPIPSWRRQVTRLRSRNNPHSALSTYQSFMTLTSSVRDVLHESAAAAEAEIDRLIDERRGK